MIEFLIMKVPPRPVLTPKSSKSVVNDPSRGRIKKIVAAQIKVGKESKSAKQHLVRKTISQVSMCIVELPYQQSEALLRHEMRRVYWLRLPSFRIIKTEFIKHAKTRLRSSVLHAIHWVHTFASWFWLIPWEAEQPKVKTYFQEMNKRKIT